MWLKKEKKSKKISIKKKKHKTGNKDREYNKNRPQKRQYEKHSGTGRGRETAKNGAGGKTVWGDNPEQIARQAKHYGSRDDQLFESVLNPKKENVEAEPIVEEAKEQVAEEAKVEETAEVQGEQKWDRKRKGKEEVVEEEIPEAERLNRPEGAVGLAEYKLTLVEKNKKLNGPAKAAINHALPSDLKVIEKETLSVKDKKVVKAKKQKGPEQIAVTLKTEDLSNANAPRYQKPDYHQKEQPKKVQKAKINFDDLPSL